MFIGQRGFSLISVLIATAIAGGLAIYVLTISDNALFVQQRTSSSIEVSELLTEARLILEDEKNCRISFAGENPTLSPVTFRKSEVDEPTVEAGLPVEIFTANFQGTERLKKRFSSIDDAYKNYGKIHIAGIHLFMNNGTGLDYPDGASSDIGIIRFHLRYSLNKDEKDIYKDLMIRLNFTTASGISTITGCSLGSGGGGGGATDFEDVCSKYPGHTWDGTNCIPPNEQTRLVAFQLRYNGATWVPGGTSVLYSTNPADKLVNIVVDSVEVIGPGRHKLRVQFDGFFIDSTEIFSAQYIGKENATMKMSLNDSDGNNKIEIIKADDNSDNNWVNGDKINFIFSTPRL